MVYQRINYEERILFSIRLKENWDYQSIANELNRSKGTISRDVNRGSIIDFGEHIYSADFAHQRANEQTQIRHRKPLILELNGMLKFVIPKLKKRWSSQKISTWL